jgi:hypothetical protein
VFDLNLIPLHNINGQEKPELPGLAGYNPPRRPARGRSGDQLLVLLTLSENPLISSREVQPLIDLLAETFYKTSGSVTSAIRTAVDSLSHSLMDFNAARGANNRKNAGTLNLAVLHGSTIYLSHVGATHTYLILKGEVQHFHDPDPQQSPTPLGLNHPVPVRFFQVENTAGCSILFCAAPPTEWASSLDSGIPLPQNDLQVSLVPKSGEDLRAALIHLQQGSGKITQEQGEQGCNPSAER